MSIVIIIVIIKYSGTSVHQYDHHLAITITFAQISIIINGNLFATEQR